ncbi:IclR family transcriptional regulator [Paraburkholderia sp. BL18I3N2]|uniref:IclR family transcriptional regulator n=1 Tax=Paraburkholderia sp. BL18I3N2 TaxID=1938799 RepID=UPI000D074BC1|nr:helix-turn-helix domain-containing protein [Paraburkholderia sp. BL18I3N2]PRX33434.1 IclR family transcriptional regulator [Paraburkholderia sp. BL18I3N2]
METAECVEQLAPRRTREQRGIHAMEVGGTLLQHLADAGKPVSMLGLSAATALPLNQVFTYMVSLVRTGLVRRDSTTQSFEPGPLALKLGLRALAQLHPLHKTVELAIELLKDDNHGAFVAIWTDHGPTVIRYHGPEMYLHVGLHVGSVMSIAHSSTGRLFAAFLQRQTIEPMLAREFAKADAVSAGCFVDVIENFAGDVRRTHLSRTLGVPIPGVDSLSAPVFDRGQMVLSVTIFGPSSTLDTSDTGTVARGLLQLSEKLSS